MIIRNLRDEIIKDRPTILADVVFEDNHFSETTIYFQTEKEFGQGLHLEPNAFFLACSLVAMRSAEKRIKMDAEVCPELIEGLTCAITCLIGWYGGKRILPRFEVKKAKNPATNKVNRAGSFLSGGIDSQSCLWQNRLLYPLSHPASIKDSFFIYGSADIGVIKEETKVYERGLNNLQEIARKIDLQIIPVFTNVRDLSFTTFPLDFYVLEYHSCMLAAIGHAFSKRVDRVTIGSAYGITHLKPFGTHPLLDLNYGSFNLKIKHGAANLSRRDRVALIGEWQFGLDRIRTCLYNDPNLLNCGKCWKCMITQAELLAIGKLHQSKAFPNDDLTEEMLLNHHLQFELERESYLDLIDDFMNIGREELADAVKKIVLRFDQTSEKSSPDIHFLIE